MWRKKDVKKLVNGVWEGKFSDTNPPMHLFRHTANELTEAFEEGWGRQMMTDPDIYSPDRALAASFQRNIFYFSANKSITQVKELQALMFDTEGNRRTRYEFVKDALKVDETFNAQYLAAEYTLTHRVATAAREWEGIESTKDIYPIIEWVTVMDGNTRHSAYNGIKLPVEHEFWDEHPQPLEYGCRCRKRRHMADQVQVSSATDYQDIPKAKAKPWHSNAYRAKAVWKNDEHPYGQELTKEQKAAASRVVDAAIAAIPPILVSKRKNGGRVSANLLHGDGEWDVNMPIANTLADLGDDVRLRPNINRPNASNYDATVVTKGKPKRVEFKSINGNKNAVNDWTGDANKKNAEVVLLDITGDVDGKDLLGWIMAALGRKTNSPEPKNSRIKEVWVMRGSKVARSERQLTADFQKKVIDMFKNTEDPPK